LVLDIDHFKKVNDTFGHQAGDVALQIVSSILQKHVRSSDICARFGGEEFTILASSTTAEAAMFLAEKIRREVETTSITCDSVTFKITVSIGVAELSQESHACSTALKDGIRAADCAMYTAKKSGRNRSVQWSGEECITA
jgi:diguanylate cyclase (GGDEF)-like protein